MGFEPTHGSSPPSSLANCPLDHLGTSPNIKNYEIKKQSYDWCKKLLIDIVFCSISFRNIWKRTSIPLTSYLRNLYAFLSESPEPSLMIPSWLVDSIKPYVPVRNTTPNVEANPAVLHHTSPCILCRGVLLFSNWWAGPESNGRPLIFSQVYQPCIPPAHIRDAYTLQIIGVEPMTHCLTDNCSTS